MPIFDTVDNSVTETGVPADSGSVDFEAVKKRIFGSRSKSAKRKSATEENPEPSPEKELEKLFAAENWEGVSSMYFDVRYALTGYDGFLLTETQKKTLGLSMGNMARLLLKIDPGYIAMIIFCANFGGLIATKEMQYKMIIREMEKRDGKKAS